MKKRFGRCGVVAAFFEFLCEGRDAAMGAWSVL
jgi:hypothetical protein